MFSMLIERQYDHLTFGNIINGHHTLACFKWAFNSLTHCTRRPLFVWCVVETVDLKTDKRKNMRLRIKRD